MKKTRCVFFIYLKLFFVLLLELEGIGEMSDVYTHMKRIPGREQLA